MDKVEKPELPGERRRHQRADIYHPINFRLFSRNVPLTPIEGHLQNLSLGGARIALHDPQGRFNGKFRRGLRTTLQIALPDSEPMDLMCVVTWARPSGEPGSGEFEIGLDFTEMEARQLEKIELFMSSRQAGQTMVWNLLDSASNGAR